MNTQVITITPTKAAAMLAKNPRNRRIRQSHVQRLAGAMSRGEWQLNGEAMKLDPNGSIIDGQHRLLAVVKSGVTIKTLVIYDMSFAIQHTMDQGARRSIGDVLNWRGEKDGKNLAGALRFIWLHEQGNPNAGIANFTPNIAIALLDEHPQLRESMLPARRLYDAIRYRPTLGGFIHYHLSSIDRDDGEHFFDHLMSGANLADDSPILMIREAVQDEVDISRRAYAGIRPSPTRIWALTIKAWNAYRSGTTIKQLKFSPGGANPEAFPVAR